MWSETSPEIEVGSYAQKLCPEINPQIGAGHSSRNWLGKYGQKLSLKLEQQIMPRNVEEIMTRNCAQKLCPEIDLEIGVGNLPRNWLGNYGQQLGLKLELEIVVRNLS